MTEVAENTFSPLREEVEEITEDLPEYDPSQSLVESEAQTARPKLEDPLERFIIESAERMHLNPRDPVVRRTLEIDYLDEYVEKLIKKEKFSTARHFAERYFALAPERERAAKSVGLVRYKTALDPTERAKAVDFIKEKSAEFPSMAEILQGEPRKTDVSALKSAPQKLSLPVIQTEKKRLVRGGYVVAFALTFVCWAGVMVYWFGGKAKPVVAEALDPREAFQCKRTLEVQKRRVCIIDKSTFDDMHESERVRRLSYTSAIARSEGLQGAILRSETGENLGELWSPDGTR